MDPFDEPASTSTSAESNCTASTELVWPDKLCAHNKTHSETQYDSSLKQTKRTVSVTQGTYQKRCLLANRP
jgi:hypothetical protein